VVADSDIDGLRDTFEELQTLVGDQSPQTSRRLGFSRRIANRWTRNWNDSSNATTSVSSGLKRGNHPMTTKRPFHDFTERLAQFADGRRGIRNPFVIVPVQPKYERRVAERLTEWATNPHRTEEFPDDGTVQVLRLDELFVETDVFELAVDLGENSQPATITETMQDRLAEELVAIMVEKIDAPAQQRHVVLLTHLGSLYPFTRASELLDELDRRNVQSTIGIPFPGNIYGGKLNFFGEESRNYYPAHQIEGRVEGCISNERHTHFTTSSSSHRPANSRKSRRSTPERGPKTTSESSTRPTAPATCSPRSGTSSTSTHTRNRASSTSPRRSGREDAPPEAHRVRCRHRIGVRRPRRRVGEQMAGLPVVPTERRRLSRRPAEARLPEPPQPGRVTGTAAPLPHLRGDRPRTRVSHRPELAARVGVAA